MTPPPRKKDFFIVVVCSARLIIASYRKLSNTIDSNGLKAEDPLIRNHSCLFIWKKAVRSAYETTVWLQPRHSVHVRPLCTWGVERPLLRGAFTLHLLQTQYAVLHHVQRLDHVQDSRDDNDLHGGLDASRYLNFGDG